MSAYVSVERVGLPIAALLLIAVLAGCGSGSPSASTATTAPGTASAANGSSASASTTAAPTASSSNGELVGIRAFSAPENDAKARAELADDDACPLSSARDLEQLIQRRQQSFDDAMRDSGADQSPGASTVAPLKLTTPDPNLGDVVVWCRAYAAFQAAAENGNPEDAAESYYRQVLGDEAMDTPPAPLPDLDADGKAQRRTYNLMAEALNELQANATN